MAFSEGTHTLPETELKSLKNQKRILLLLLSIILGSFMYYNFGIENPENIFRVTGRPKAEELAIPKAEERSKGSSIYEYIEK